MNIDTATDTADEQQLQVEDSDDSCILEYTETAPLTEDADVSCTLQEEETDDSCILEYIEILPLAGDTDGSCTAECVGGDWSTEIVQESLAVVKQEPDDVCCILCVYFVTAEINSANDPYCSLHFCGYFNYFSVTGYCGKCILVQKQL